MGEHIKKEYSKYLGVLIDKTLSWTNHIKHANLKISMGKAILNATFLKIPYAHHILSLFKQILIMV